MTPEEMKTVWKSTQSREITGNDKLKCQIGSLIGKKTSLDHLRATYRRYMTISIGMLAANLIFLYSDIVDAAWRVTLVVVLDIYFVICAVMDSWLYVKTGEIDVFNMSVKEIATIAVRCRRRHHQFMLALIPLALALAYFLIFICADEISVRTGAVVGGLVGGLIGFSTYRKIMKDYRALSETDDYLSDE